MGGNRYRARRARGQAEVGLGRMLLVSLAIHGAVLVLFTGVLLPRFERERRPVYYVDLVNLPVMSPQAGRPDARPEKAEPAKKPEPAPAPAPVAKKAEPAAKKAAVPAKPKPAPAKKAEPAKKPAPPPERYEETLSAIEQLKRKREIEALKEKLAALGSADTRRAPGAAPVGMADGKGTEAGTSYDAWLHTFLKEAWTLSKYQVSRRDLEATVHLVFDPRGRLLDYRFLEKSGEDRFDDSVRRAVLQLETLPTEPGRRLEKEVVFNLKELLE